MNLQTEQREYEAPKIETAWSRVKKALGPITVVGVLIAKFFAKLKFVLLPLLKFLPILLKSGGTMLLMVWVYTQFWGWPFAVGFVLLLLVHESGHLLVARKFGLKVGAPVFIPFMGAFIALKDAPRNAWMEACVGIGGPMLGSLGALVCNVLGEMFSAPIFIALLSLPRIYSLFRKRTEEEQRYFEVTPSQRWTMSILYFGLIAILLFGMHVAQQDLNKHSVRSHGHGRDAIVQ